MTKRKYTLGIILAITGSLFWGIQGPISQFLFQDASYSPSWLMGVKDSIAGILIILYAGFIQHHHVFHIWRDKKYLLLFLAYALLGLVSVQYFYLVTVKASNAGTGTILQNSSIVLVTIITIIMYRRLPTKYEWVALFAAIIGTWMLITKGHLTSLAITKAAFYDGALLIIANTFHTVLPAPLLKHYDTSILVGWAMILGGLIFSWVHPFWIDPPKFTMGTFTGVAFIVIFSTVLSFMFYISSMKYISPTVAAMLENFEPLSATVGAIVFLGVPFNGPEIVGGLLILSVVFILALDPTRR